MVVFTTFCFRSVRSHTGLGACKLAKCDAFIESAKEPRSEYVCAVTVDSLMLTLGIPVVWVEAFMKMLHLWRMP